VSLTAYSGGTVWDLHPLRVAAGANVMLSRRPGHRSTVRSGRIARPGARRVYRNPSAGDLYSPGQLNMPHVASKVRMPSASFS